MMKDLDKAEPIDDVVLVLFSLSSTVLLLSPFLLVTMNRVVAQSSRLDARSCVSGWLPAAAAAATVNQYPHCAYHLSFSLPRLASITLFLCFSLTLREPSVALRRTRSFSFTLTLSFLCPHFSLLFTFFFTICHFLSSSVTCILSPFFSVSVIFLFYLLSSPFHSLFLPRYRSIFFSLSSFPQSLSFSLFLSTWYTRQFCLFLFSIFYPFPKLH